MRPPTATNAGACVGFFAVAVFMAPWHELAADEGRRLAVVPQAIESVYEAPHVEGVESSVKGAYVFYQGEPVIIAVRLLNATRTDVQFPGGRTFETLVTKTVRRRSDQQELRAVEWRRQPDVHAIDGSAGVPPNAHGEVLWLLAGANGEPLPGGVFRLDAEIRDLGDERLPHRRVTLKDSVVAEVRPVRTRLERMDFYYHMGVRYRMALRNADARDMLNALLTLNPTSVYGHAELGEISRREGKCEEARGLIERAARFAEGRRDPEATRLSNQRVITEWARNARARTATCR